MDERRFYLIPVVFLLLLFVFSSNAMAQIIEVHYEFKAPGVTDVDGYVDLNMERCSIHGKPGLPALPVKPARILLPYMSKVRNITVIPGDKMTLANTYKIKPGQRPVPLSYKGKVEFTPPNPDIYGSSAPYPGKFYTEYSVQSKRGYQILIVNLQPVEYLPRPGIISYWEELIVRVHTEEGLSKSPGPRHSIRRKISKPIKKTAMRCPFLHKKSTRDRIIEKVDNPEIINAYPEEDKDLNKSRLEVGAQYLIITNEELSSTPGPDNFQDLCDSKIARGISATIITTEWIYDNYDGTRPDGGTDNQTRIRNCIIDYYTNQGTEYVLLAGDGDGADVGGESGDFIIPARSLAVLGFEDEDDDIASDLYYACLDGSFDHNANGIYGEPDDGPGGGFPDIYAEVYVGRACVDSEEEVRNFVKKVFAYEATTGGYLDDALMAGEDLDWYVWGCDYKDEIKEGSCNYGYCTIGFENAVCSSFENILTLCDRDCPGNDWPKSEIMDIINNGIHCINHLGHAGVMYSMKMFNWDIDNLSNEDYFIGYSQGCYSGSFDNRTGFESPYYTGYDSAAEHFSCGEHGAVAFIANSRYGWGNKFNTDGPSQHFDREFWDAILGECILEIGIANQDSKEDNDWRIIADLYDRWCAWNIILFGDPEMKFREMSSCSKCH